MKKLILILSTTALLFACSSPLDKKVKTSDYEQVINEIKSSNNVYSDKDYDRAADILGKKAFGSIMAGENSSLEMTYRELLDDAKEKNDSDQTQLDSYKEEMSKLTDVFSIKAIDGEYFDTSEEMPLYPNLYSAEILATNHSDKKIVAFKGDMILKNTSGDKLMRLHFDETVVFDPKESIETTFNSSILQGDNLTELKVLPFNKIEFTWEPSLIIFEDGSRLEAPDKPYALLEKPY